MPEVMEPHLRTRLFADSGPGVGYRGRIERPPACRLGGEHEPITIQRRPDRESTLSHELPEGVKMVEGVTVHGHPRLRGPPHLFRDELTLQRAGHGPSDPHTAMPAVDVPRAQPEQLAPAGACRQRETNARAGAQMTVGAGRGEDGRDDPGTGRKSTQRSTHSPTLMSLGTRRVSLSCPT